MATTYTEVQVLDANNNFTYIDSIILKVDAYNNVIQAYLASDPTKNILIPTSAGTDTGYQSQDFNGTNLGDLYNNPGTVWTQYDNIYDTSSSSSTFRNTGGILLSTLGSTIDALMIQNASNIVTDGSVTFNIGDSIQYNISQYIYNANVEQSPWSFSLPYILNYIDNVSCFCEDTQILCADGTTESIQNLTPGTLVKTLRSGPKRVVTVGRRVVNEFNKSNRVQDRVYTYKDSGLQITGKHCVLVDELTELQEDIVSKIFGFVKMIEGKYALPVWLDNKAQFVSSENEVSLYHIVLESEEEHEAYGVCANGVWAESCSAYDFEKYSGMVPINI